MKCEKCGMDGLISEQTLHFENDDTAEKDTEAYYMFRWICRNPECVNFESEIGEKKVRLL
jgi:hypothetical protein